MAERVTSISFGAAPLADMVIAAMGDIGAEMVFVWGGDVLVSFRAPMATDQAGVNVDYVRTVLG